MPMQLVYASLKVEIPPDLLHGAPPRGLRLLLGGAALLVGSGWRGALGHVVSRPSHGLVHFLLFLVHVGSGGS